MAKKKYTFQELETLTNKTAKSEDNSRMPSCLQAVYRVPGMQVLGWAMQQCSYFWFIQFFLFVAIHP